MTRLQFLIRMLAALILFGQTAPLLAEPEDIAAASRSVVRIIVIGTDGRDIFYGRGSGFAVAPGKVVTNAHVVESAYDYPNQAVVGVVPSEAGEIQPARIIAYSPSNDLALLQIEGDIKLPLMTIFTASVPDGADVTAIGYPASVDDAQGLGLGDVINPMTPVKTRGNYSGGRSSTRFQTVLHTAPIAGGNSGGPLVDACGRLVGVNTFGTVSHGSDAEFFFAVAPSELMRFLRQNDIKPPRTDARCRSLAEIQREEADRAEQAEAEQAATEAKLAQEKADRRKKAERQIMEERENAMAMAALLLALALVAAGAGAILQQKDMRKPAIAAFVAAPILLIGAIALFFSRPSLDGIDERESQLASTGTDQSDEQASKDIETKEDGKMLCTILSDRSRITVSNPDSFPLAWESGGCVNDGTQYGQDDGLWYRAFVPNEEQTITLSSFDPKTREFVTERYLMPYDAMERAREIRQRYDNKSCTTDEAIKADIDEMVAAIRDELPQNANERLVYDCEPED